MAPKMAQDGPNMAHDGPKKSPRWPPEAEDGPKRAQDKKIRLTSAVDIAIFSFLHYLQCKITIYEPEDGPTDGPRWPKMPQDGPKMGPR